MGRSHHGCIVPVGLDVDPTSAEDAEAHLQVVRHILARLRQEEVDANWPNEKAGPQAARERIEHELARARIESGADGGLVLPNSATAGPSLAEAPTESGIRLALSQLGQTNSEPEQRIGAAKDLVEAVIKFALDQLGEIYDPKEKLPALAKQLHKRMRLTPESVAPTTEGADVLVRILGSITTIPQCLAELHNLGYGTGQDLRDCVLVRQQVYSALICAALGWSFEAWVAARRVAVSNARFCSGPSASLARRPMIEPAIVEAIRLATSSRATVSIALAPTSPVG